MLHNIINDIFRQPTSYFVLIRAFKPYAFTLSLSRACLFSLFSLSVARHAHTNNEKCSALASDQLMPTNGADREDLR